jgi:DNA-directed RNA polymerase subunit K/omega
MPPKKDDKKLNIIQKDKKVSFNDIDSKDDITSSSESGSENSDNEIEDEPYENIEDDDDSEDSEDSENSEDSEDSDEEDDDKKSKSKKEDDVDDGVDEDCVYRFTKNIDESDDDDIDDFFDDDKELLMKDIFIPNADRITKPVLTRYERVRLLQERTTQLSLGAKPMLKGIPDFGNSKKIMDPKEIAKIELINKVIPMVVIRTLPNGKKEKWKLSELSILN